MYNSTNLYTDGKYEEKFKDWHLSDAESKVKDIAKYLQFFVGDRSPQKITIGDIGCGFGGVSNGILKWAAHQYPQVSWDINCFEISAYAATKAKEIFPHLKVFNRNIAEQDGPLDILLFIDVLEHLENPSEFLRQAAIGEYIIVRQPLLENYSTFRNKNYKSQREEWGHIAYFSYYSFIDLMESNGWIPYKIDLVPPWELNTREKFVKLASWKKILTTWDKTTMSYFISGFYLNGIFKRK